MFERHFGLRENPFHSGHQLRFLYPSREHQEARAHLRYGIENREPFVLITGEVGTGKTTALYDALAEWGSRVTVALITNSSLTRQELIEEIGLRFGLTVPAGASKPQALALLERHLNGVRTRGEHAVLLLDEAQNLAPELLEEIRLLSNLEAQGEKLVQIFLVGQPELEAQLARPELRQLRQRIAVHYRLNPLSPEETTSYIHHRVAVAGGNPWATFPTETCREVYRVTHGIPREINTVAQQSLIAAFSEGAITVQPAHVAIAARENEFRSVLGEPTVSAAPPAPPAPPTPEAAPVVAPAPERAADPPARVELPTAAAAEPEAVLDMPASASAPAWTPPELGATFASTPDAPAEPLAIVDAWAAASQELMEARRRNDLASEPSSRVEVIAPPRQPAPADAVTPRFPTPAELYARAEQARPDEADLSGLPERLREKIAADIAAEERHDARKRRALPMLLAAVAIVAIAVAAVMLQRFQVIDVPVLRAIAGSPVPDHTPATAVAPAPVAPVAAVALLDSSGRLAHDTTATSPPPKPAPSQVAPAPGSNVLAASSARAAVQSHVTNPVVAAPSSNPAATSAPAPATAKPAAPAIASAKPPASARTDSTVFGLGVASYLDRDRAEQERARLSALAGLPAVVVPYRDGDATKYRIVVGNYHNNGAAERAALDLMTKLGVSEARPLILSRAKPR